MKTQVAGLSLAVLLAPALAASALAGPAPETKHVHRVFDIMREGSKIGTDTFDITRQGDATSVKVNTHIVVKIAFITAYRYDHSEAGSWKGAQLVSFKSTTDDNGTDHQINAAQSGGKIALTVDGAATTAPKSMQAASLWGAAVSRQTQMFDPANGKRLAVDVADLGEETLEMNGVPRQVDHVKLTGALPRDLWFDEDGLVKMTLRGSDNSEITSQLRTSTASN